MELQLKDSEGRGDSMQGEKRKAAVGVPAMGQVKIEVHYELNE